MISIYLNLNPKSHMDHSDHLELELLLIGIALIIGGFWNILSSFGKPNQGRYDFFVYVVSIIAGMGSITLALSVKSAL